MRTIRFRGKRLLDNKFVYGSLVQCLDGSVGIFNGNDFEHHKIFAVKKTSIGEFTGLTDRHGKGIYEGDILVIEGIKYPRHYIVSWNTEKLMFCIGDTPLYALLEAGSTTIREYSVCGNIHDNHKLLKDEKD